MKTCYLNLLPFVLALLHFKVQKTVAVLMTNIIGVDLVDFFEKNNRKPFFEGFFNDDKGLYMVEEGGILSSEADQICVVARNGISEVYFSPTSKRMFEPKRLLGEAEKQCVRLKFVLNLTSTLAYPPGISYMVDFSAFSLRKERYKFRNIKIETDNNLKRVPLNKETTAFTFFKTIPDGFSGSFNVLAGNMRGVGRGASYELYMA
jgi:hypothetical protein